MQWPNGKKFAFTILDDTDNSTIENTAAIYELLNSCNIKTTKSLWVYPPKDDFTGQCLEDDAYLNFVKDLEKKGFELALHSVGSGKFTRKEIISGLEKYKNLLGAYPNIHINHAENIDSLYWGYKRFVFPLRFLYKLISKKEYLGDTKNSDYFWGDIAKENIKFIRNRAFKGINTGKYDKHQPYVDSKNKYSNYWFSSSDGDTINEFNTLTSPKNIDQLEKENGLCIVYTHFAKGFVGENGKLDPEFKSNIQYMANKDAWFAPVSEILEYLLQQGRGKKISYLQSLKLDFYWLYDRINKKLKFKH